MNVRPARATYFRLCLKEKKRGKFLHTHKMETTETPGKTKATGITTQDLSRKESTSEVMDKRTLYM